MFFVGYNNYSYLGYNAAAGVAGGYQVLTCAGPWPVFSFRDIFLCWTLNCMFRAMDLCWTLTCIFPGLWPCVGPSPPGLLSCHCFSRILRFNHPILCFILHCLTLLLILFHWLKSKTLTASSDLADLNTLRWFLHYFFSLHCNYLWANPSGAPQKKLKALDAFWVPVIN